MKRPPLKQGDVFPAHVLRDEYGMNAENRPVIVVNPAEVPEDLKTLIPAVERWAIPCDVTRGDYFDQQSEEDIARFWYDVLPYRDRIHAWLGEQPENVAEWPDAAVHYMYFLKAHGGAWQPTEEERQQAEQRRVEWEYQRSLRDAIERGLAAFKAKDYSTVVDALQPFEDALDRVTSAKFVYARKKHEG